MLILDTNVLSEAMLPSPSTRVMGWWSQESAGGDFHITTITVAEILYGIEVLPQGKRRDLLFLGAERMFRTVFSGRILPFDEAAARLFAQIAAHRRTLGRPLAEMDGQIAAIARVHGALVATRNMDDFKDCGVRLVNPWRRPNAIRE